MSDLQQMRYKETSPQKTVKRIKEILKNNNVEVEENWTKKSSVNTYSLRLCIKGTNLGQNGKGMTKDFALASAYAEFLERYQNGMLVFRTEKPNQEFPFLYSADEKKLSLEELANQNDSFIEQIFEENKEECKTKLELLEKIFGNEKQIISLPQYSVRDKKIVYIPHVLSCHLVGSNGMCAGNRPEEALIEGISEILERYVSMQIIYQKLALPEIPEEFIERFPKVKEMYQKLKKSEEYVCKLLDCSMGGKYPVAGLIILQKNTGRFGFKLGAHPDYGIAMERCFTEAAQGMDIYTYAQGCIFDFKNEDLDNAENIREFVDKNVATLPYQLLSPEKSYKFTEVEDVSNLNNSQILNKLVNKILKEGHDIIIRDVSTLGFPSFRVIIPGMTEVTRTKMAGRYREFEDIEYLLKDLNRINLNNLPKVIQMLETLIYDGGFESLYFLMNVKDTNLLPCEKINNGAKYFLAICYIMNKEYKKAEKILEEILFIASNLIPEDITTVLVRAVYYYSEAMSRLNSHQKAMEYINLLFDTEIAEAIDFSFNKRENILLNHYLVKQEDYVENDDTYYLPFMKTLKKVQKENIIDQMELKDLFNYSNFETKEKLAIK